METLRQPLKETRTASLNVPRVLSPTDFTSRTSFYGINTDVDKDLAEKVHSNNDWKIHQFVCISIQTYEYLSIYLQVSKNRRVNIMERNPH